MLPHDKAEKSCCASEPSTTQDQTPTQADKANCAVCFWAAGILPESPLILEFRPLCTALIEAQNALAQYAERFISASTLPRGPPIQIG